MIEKKILWAISTFNLFLKNALSWEIVGKNNPTIPLKKSLSLILTHLTYFAITIIFWMYVYVQDLLDFNYEEGKEEIIYSHREMCPTENWARELLAKEFLQFL